MIVKQAYDVLIAHPYFVKLSYETQLSIINNALVNFPSKMVILDLVNSGEITFNPDYYFNEGITGKNAQFPYALADTEKLSYLNLALQRIGKLYPLKYVIVNSIVEDTVTYSKTFDLGLTHKWFVYAPILKVNTIEFPAFIQQYNRHPIITQVNQFELGCLTQWTKANAGKTFELHVSVSYVIEKQPSITHICELQSSASYEKNEAIVKVFEPGIQHHYFTIHGSGIPDNTITHTQEIDSATAWVRFAQ